MHIAETLGFLSLTLFITSALRAENPSLKADIIPAGSRIALSDKVTRPFVFTDKAWFIWGSSCVKGEDGRYHLYYDRWRRDNPRGMQGWLYDTEIAHAVAEHPEGPYKFAGTAVPSRHGDDPERWDAFNAHNAMIARMPDPSGRIRYYLYFISNHDTRLTTNNWMNHVLGQRIGVAIADKPEGPFVRVAEPACVPNGIAHHYVVNPGVCRLPDGRYLMVLKSRTAGTPKANGEPNPGPMIHAWAIAMRPEGPFIVQPGLLFPPELSAEDPCVWVSDGKVFAAVKDWQGKVSGAPGIARIEGVIGADGAIAWSIPKDANISPRRIRWDDGKVTKLHTLERPYVLCNDKGEPTHLFAAAALQNEFVNGSPTPRKPNDPVVPDDSLPFNLCLPLKSN